MKLHFISLCIITSILSCCSSPKVFQTFESSKWIEDGKNCISYRQSVIEDMKTEFDKLYGLDENEMMRILGRPEETHLYMRGQKFIYYRIKCSSDSDKLKIRFSALGLVNEVLIWKE